MADAVQASGFNLNESISPQCGVASTSLAAATQDNLLIEEDLNSDRDDQVFAPDSSVNRNRKPDFSVN